MKISYNWLQSLLPEKVELNQLSNILTSVGLEVEAIEEHCKFKGGLQGLVIGKILSAEKHENADKLQVCVVDIGLQNPSTIVCGAPNAAAGQTVIVATPGTTIYPTSGEPFTIKEAKIRGINSSGMICAEDEIGLGNSHNGIIVINEAIEPGTLAKDFYNIGEVDYIIEIGLTPNRMDAMSHMGVAKDVCAYLANLNNKPYIQIIPNSPLPNAELDYNLQVNILDEACKRYAALVITDVTVKDSPEWLQQKLIAIGSRPINNIVDITNYILHECGQPLHAFDGAIVGNTINVKCMADGTKFISLDNKDRILTDKDLMICNDKEPMCIAGVFGGASSGVNSNTKTIVLESAWFAPKSIRQTSMHHGLRTDAAIRFEKGVDISQTIYALQRAASLIITHAGGKIASNLIDVYPTPIEPTTVKITYEYINRLSGANYSKLQVKNILAQLCFGIIAETEEELSLQVPYAKPDITIPADIVEEIMRIDGIDNIPFTGKISFSLSETNKNTNKICKETIAHMLVAKGFYELFTNSITNSKFYPDNDKLVRMINSLSAELDVLRPQMLESGLQSISHNINRKNSNLLFFEFGKTYANYNGKYAEEEQLAFYITGNTHTENWALQNKAVDVFYVKGVVAAILEKLEIDAQITSTEKGIFIQKKKQVLGQIVNVPAETLKLFDIKQEVWHVYFKWASLVSASKEQEIKFAPISKFMGVRRDLALTLKKSVAYSAVEESILKANIALLQQVNVFDVFESEKLGLENKSYAISLQFADATRTLTDIEVEESVQKIITQLSQDVGAVIR